MADVNCPRPDKAAHKSRKAAEMELLGRWLTIEDINTRLRLETYRCRCGAWHIGKRSNGQEME